MVHRKPIFSLFSHSRWLSLLSVVVSYFGSLSDTCKIAEEFTGMRLFIAKTGETGINIGTGYPEDLCVYLSSDLP